MSNKTRLTGAETENKQLQSELKQAHEQQINLTADKSQLQVKLELLNAEREKMTSSHQEVIEQLEKQKLVIEARLQSAEIELEKSKLKAIDLQVNLNVLLDKERELFHLEKGKRVIIVL